MCGADAAAEKDFFLLIGDRAIDFQRASHIHEIFDLGAAWTEMTNLPFVYAIWALRRGIENKELRRELRERAGSRRWWERVRPRLGEPRGGVFGRKAPGGIRPLAREDCLASFRMKRGHAQ